MNDRQKCLNHPERHAVSFCHGCGKFFCEECLVEGPEYYYCRRESCMKLYEQAVEAARESQPIVEPTSQPSPVCELAEDEKAWIEDSYHWLIDQFGTDTLASARVALPTKEFFPAPYDGSDASVRRIIDRVCDFMKVDPARIDFMIYQDHDPATDFVPIYQSSHRGAAGLFLASDSEDKLILALEFNQLGQLESLVATIAHELGHVHLLADKRLTGEEPDHEPLTDLLTVFFGMGVFTSNVAFRFSQWQDVGFHGWKARRTGYLSEPMYGYSLAAFCWMRQELQPKWLKYLTLNIKHYLKRYLRDLKDLRDLDEIEYTRLPKVR